MVLYLTLAHQMICIRTLFKLLLVECRFYWCYQFFLKTTHYLSTKYFHLKPFFTGHEKIFEGWIGLQFKSMFTFLLLNLFEMRRLNSYVTRRREFFYFNFFEELFEVLWLVFVISTKNMCLLISLLVSSMKR